MAETTVLGIVAIKNCGEYDSETSYEKLNVVTYQGSSYCAIRDTVGNLPTDTDYWQLYAEKGDKGDTGSQGPKPVKGVDYWTVEDKAAISTEISNDVAQQVSASVGNLTSAAPLAVSSTSEMTDTTRIYVNTTDGKWYYYDGDSWEIGGTYQSTGIADNSITIAMLASDVDTIFDLTSPVADSTETNYRIKSTGEKVSENGHSISYFLGVKKGYTVKVKARAGTAVAVISKVNENDYTPYVMGRNSSALEDYYYTIPEDCTIAIGYQTTYSYTISVYIGNKYLYDENEDRIEEIDSIIEKEYPEFTTSTGHFIGSSGAYNDQSGWGVSSVIELKKGKTIHVNAAASSSVSVIAKKNTDNSYSSLVIGTNGDALVGYEYQATEDTNIVLSYKISYGIAVYDYYNVEKFVEAVTNLLNEKLENIFSMFTNITCCGDSLTRCVVYTGREDGQDITRQAYRPWPSILGSKTGATIDNIAMGGYDASEWWTAYQNNIVSKPNQLAIIYLGTNTGLTDTVDTDCAGDDPDNWANNCTGDYARIIHKCLSVGAKVLLVKCYAHNPDTNNAIEDLAEKFNVAWVENPKLKDMIYHYWPDLTGYNSTHYNDLGYTKFCEQLINNTSNLSDEMITRLLPQ